MAQIENNIIDLIGKIDELTVYKRNGKTYTQKSHIHQPRRLSRSQLAQREQLAHNNALWRVFKKAKELHFEGGTGPYYRFMSVNKLSPTVYLTKLQISEGFTLLLPDTVISDGPLPPIGYRLDEMEGQPALLTDLPVKEARKGRLLLYTLRQYESKHQIEGVNIPKLELEVEEVDPEETVTTADGCIALTGERFADPMKGFALVRMVDGHASQQRIVTRCTYYQRFTTEEALQAAAKSYKGLTR